MIHSVRFTAVLDTNIIYPIIIRDLLFWFAHYDLYTPKWSTQIFNEWERLMIRKDVDKMEIKKRIQNANLAFPDAMVKNYERLIDYLQLPDENDRHVLAAADRKSESLLKSDNTYPYPFVYGV